MISLQILERIPDDDFVCVSGEVSEDRVIGKPYERGWIDYAAIWRTSWSLLFYTCWITPCGFDHSLFQHLHNSAECRVNVASQLLPMIIGLIPGIQLQLSSASTQWGINRHADMIVGVGRTVSLGSIHGAVRIAALGIVWGSIFALYRLDITVWCCSGLQSALFDWISHSFYLFLIYFFNSTLSSLLFFSIPFLFLFSFILFLCILNPHPRHVPALDPEAPLPLLLHPDFPLSLSLSCREFFSFNLVLSLSLSLLRLSFPLCFALLSTLSNPPHWGL